MIIKGYLFSIIYGLLCIFVAGIAHKMGLKSVYTRKITHILVGFEWVILYHFFGTSIHFIIVCLIFSLIVAISYYKNLLPQFSSEENNSPGTLYYCIAMTTMAIISYFLPAMAVPFGIGVFCTSLGDGLAGVFGQIKVHNKRIYGDKTLFGSIACFVFGLIFSLLIIHFYELNLEFYHAVIIAFFATELELIGKKGIDNITVTLGASILAFAFSVLPALINYTLPIVLTLPIILLVYQKNALTKNGILIALALDVVVSLAFGNVGFLILVVFFGGSLVVDRIKKKKTNQPREKRNAKQVSANGSLGAIIALLHIIFPEDILYIAFCSVFAEALADTTASSIGALSQVAYDPFRRKTVKQGISGGMSIIGTASSLVASVIIAVISSAFYGVGITGFMVISISGFLGCIFDSFLGSLAQIKYKCLICGEITEQKHHCGEPAARHSGLSCIDNNAVNLFSTAFSAIVSIILFILLN